MAKRIRKSEPLPEDRPVALGELIHAQVRIAIETAVHEELAVTLGAGRYERQRARRGYRNGRKARTLTGPTGPLALTLPRATLAGLRPIGWSHIIPRMMKHSVDHHETAIMTTDQHRERRCTITYGAGSGPGPSSRRSAHEPRDA